MALTRQSALSEKSTSKHVACCVASNVACATRVRFHGIPVTADYSHTFR